MIAATKRQPRPRACAKAPVTDEELLLRFRDFGDERTFESLVHRYERELFSYLRRYLRDDALAEDVFQQVCWRVHEKCKQFATGCRVRPWLYHIATNLAIDALRRVGRHREVSLDLDESASGEISGHVADLVRDDTPGPLARLEAKEREQWFQHAIEQLPTEMRGLVIMAFYQGLKYREIAEVLNIPLGTVKGRLHKAFALLNAAWQKGEFAGTEYEDN